MRVLHKNIPLLGVCVCLMMSATALIVSSSALVGAALAPSPAMATFPMAALAIATMMTSLPAGKLMETIGRQRSFILSTGFGLTGATIAGFAILVSNFWYFLAGVFFIGIFNGFGNFFRFAAADSVEIAYKSKAVSYVMIGGVFAAIIGPNLANASHLWIANTEFAASYFCIVIFYILIAVVLGFVRLDDTAKPSEVSDLPKGRSLKEIATQPMYIVAVVCGMLGYGVMSLVMTATPLAMHSHALQFEDTAFVIQWHVLAMFVPSFFTGSLIAKVGVIKVMIAGALFGFACVSINLLGTTMHHFLFALICLGLCWSFLFIGATTLLTDTYKTEEKNRAQALNDFLVFSVVAVASLSAGALQNKFGWEAVNKGVMPMLLIILCSLFWLQWNKKAGRKLTSH